MWQGRYYEPQPHDEMADELEANVPAIGVGETQNKVVFLAPRRTIKTRMLIAWMAYLIFKFKEMRTPDFPHGYDVSIDYMRSTRELAKDILFELKNGLQNNPEILELFGDVSLSATLWSDLRINLGSRADHTVSAIGMDFGAAGKHPDVVIMDDLVNDKNYESLSARRLGRRKVANYSPILPPWGSMVLSGTRFTHDDVYGYYLEENQKDLRAGIVPQWREYVRGLHLKSGLPYAPRLLPPAFLEQQKRSMPPKLYAANYENSPEIEGMMRFRPEYLHYFSGLYTPYPTPSLEIIEEVAGPSGITTKTVAQFPVRTTMTIDPTVTAHGTSDWTGITVIATDATGHWWVMLCRRYLQVPSDIGDIAVGIIREFVPAICQIESANADAEMVSRIQKAISEERIPTLITGYHPLRDEDAGSWGRPSRRKKAARIEALEPRFRNQEISLHRYTCEALYDQYTHWPDVEGIGDDAIDSLAMHGSGLARACEYRTMEDLEIDLLRQPDNEDPGDLVRHMMGQKRTIRYKDGHTEQIALEPEYMERQRTRKLGWTGLGAQRPNVRP